MYNILSGGIGRHLNKNCDNKVAEPIEVQFHKVDSLTYTNSCKVQILVWGIEVLRGRHESGSVLTSLMSRNETLNLSER